MLILKTVELKKNYPRGGQTVEALRGISISVEKGEFVSIMGASGSGKSTLLHLIGGLDRPSFGQVEIAGENIASFTDQQLSLFRRRRLGFIFQFFNLLPTLNAIENVALPLLLDGVSFKKVSVRAQALLKEMGLEKRMEHYPHQLSGGEMQRVAIARAFIGEPALILADEPTGNLDSKTGLKILNLLIEMSQNKKQTILMVTHDSHAASFSGRSIRLQDGLVSSDV